MSQNKALEVIQENLDKLNNNLTGWKERHDYTTEEHKREIIKINEIESAIKELENAKEHLEQVM